MDIKSKIVKWVTEIDEVKRKDKVCRDTLRTITETSDTIGTIYAKIHKEQYADKEEFEEMTLEISKQSQVRREAERVYREFMEERFADFKTEYENIYDLAISEEGIDRETLNNVLNAFVKYQSGEVSKAGGMNQGIDYMKKKFHLPNDFLNHVPDKTE